MQNLRLTLIWGYGPFTKTQLSHQCQQDVLHNLNGHPVESKEFDVWQALRKWNQFNTTSGRHRSPQSPRTTYSLPQRMNSRYGLINRIYRVTIQVVSNLQLTPKQMLRFSVRSSYYNGTFVLVSTGGLKQLEWSPCTWNRIYVGINQTFPS